MNSNLNPKAFIELIRPMNCLLAAFAVFIGYSVALQSIEFTIASNYFVLLAMLSAFLICGAGQSINDFFDLEIDRKKQTKKPLIEYNLNPSFALIFSIILFIIGSAIAFFLGIIPFAIALTFSILLILYSAVFSRIKFIGNWLVALGTAFTLIFGASLIGDYLVVIYFAFAALLANVSRELFKDLEDLKSDQGFKKSLPMLLPENKILAITALLYIAAILIALIPFAIGKANIYFFAVILFAGLVFKSSLTAAYYKHYAIAQKHSKAGMAIALIAFLISIF